VGREVLVTGAGGLLGRTLAELLGDRAQGYTHAELDIADARAVVAAVESVSPRVVVNCAAMTNVDACESSPDEAWAANARGPENLARAAAERGAEIVHVSTDYVFDGRKGNYTEDDETNPLQVYGRAKLAGEEGVRSANPRHYVVRSAWIYGAGGKNFVSQMPRLVDEGNPMRAVDDQRSSPTYAPDLAAAIAGMFGRGRYGTYHVVNEGRVSYAEFASCMAELGGGTVEVTGIPGAEVPRPAPRPQDTSMLAGKWRAAGFSPLRPWREAAAAFWNDVHGASHG
jgi:dTDP-4-dehydrorhamnose reductase